MLGIGVLDNPLVFWEVPYQFGCNQLLLSCWPVLLWLTHSF
jgi:hypothetical protein